MIPAKNRSCLVLFQTKPEAGTSDGWGHEDTWADGPMAWVSIVPNRSKERFVSDGEETETTHTVRGEYLDLQDVVAEMRMVYHTSGVYPPATGTLRIFDISPPMADEDHHGDIMIKAREVAGGHGA